MISPCRANILHMQGATESDHPCQFYWLRLGNHKYESLNSIQPPTEPDSFQPWQKLLQQLRKATLRLPSVTFPLVTLCFWDTLEVSLLSKRVGRAQERGTALSGAGAGKNSLTGTQIYHTQSFQGDVGCVSCLCSAENLEPSHVPQTAQKWPGMLDMCQAMLKMYQITSISSFPSAAQTAERQIFFTDINKIFQL